MNEAEQQGKLKQVEHKTWGYKTWWSQLKKNVAYFINSHLGFFTDGISWLWLFKQRCLSFRLLFFVSDVCGFSLKPGEVFLHFEDVWFAKRIISWPKKISSVKGSSAYSLTSALSCFSWLASSSSSAYCNSSMLLKTVLSLSALQLTM